MMNRGRLTAALVLVLVSAGGCDEVRNPPVEVGRSAPAYQAPTLTGEQLALDDMRGEVVLLNVWATWCYPCRREMPSFEALHQEYSAQGLRVVAVSIDGAGAAREIDEFLTEYGISFTILHDVDQRITSRFRTRGVPETFLIGRDGTLVKHWIGRVDGHSESFRRPIRDALSTGQSLAGAPRRPDPRGL